ncbi:hypothetical protein ACROYT_G008412 [Oculina patagonica]
MSAPALGLTRKPSLTQEREKLEKDQQEAIAKAVNNVESAVKEKHIRNILSHPSDDNYFFVLNHPPPL